MLKSHRVRLVQFGITLSKVVSLTLIGFGGLVTPVLAQSPRTPDWQIMAQLSPPPDVHWAGKAPCDAALDLYQPALPGGSVNVPEAWSPCL